MCLNLNFVIILFVDIGQRDVIPNHDFPKWKFLPNDACVVIKAHANLALFRLENEKKKYELLAQKD
jgi:hypothetical protein